MRAPITGRIGRALLTEGTLIQPGTTEALATMQQLDPIYVDITQSVGELNRLRRDLGSGELARLDHDAANVHLIMDDNAFYPPARQLLFSDVTADPSTGQVTLRVQIPNPQDELFLGMYVRARIKQGIDSDAIAVPQPAIQRTDDGRVEVYVVRGDDTVMRQPIEVGPVVGQDWLIRSSLKAGERVVVDGVQKITVGAKVKPADQTRADSEAAPPPALDKGEKADDQQRAQAAAQQR